MVLHCCPKQCAQRPRAARRGAELKPSQSFAMDDVAHKCLCADSWLLWCRWLYVRNNTELSVSEMFAQINSPTVREPSIASLTHGIGFPDYSADDWVDYLGTGALRAIYLAVP